MTERYLLNELDSAARDQFEEHFFDCAECAQDVQAASVFIDQTKVALAKDQELVARRPAPRPVPAQARGGWLAWLRPAIAAPALAALLAIIGYQNLVTLPKMSRTLNTPNVLPWTSVNLNTLGGDGNVIRTAQGGGFLLFLRMPPEHAFNTYRADLYNPAGKLEWSLTIPAPDNQDQLPIQVPAGNRPAGLYTIQLQGIPTTGDSKIVGRSSFELQFEK